MVVFGSTIKLPREKDNLNKLFLELGYPNLHEAILSGLAMLAHAKLEYAKCTFCEEIIRREMGALPIAWMAPALGRYCCLACGPEHPAPIAFGIIRGSDIQAEPVETITGQDKERRYQGHLARLLSNQEIDYTYWEERLKTRTNPVREKYKELAIQIRRILVDEYGLKGREGLNEMMRTTGYGEYFLVYLLLGYKKMGYITRRRLCASYPKLRSLLLPNEPTYLPMSARAQASGVREGLMDIIDAYLS